MFLQLLFARSRRLEKIRCAHPDDELIALAISVAVRCDPCIAFHAQAAVKQGASRDEVMEAMGMAIYMGAGPSVMYASQAIEAYDQFKRQAATSA